MIKKRKIGSSDLHVSELGLGTMSFKSKEDTIAIIQYALEHGVNFIDTADLYSFGEIEDWIGEATQSERERFILATKGGNRWGHDRTSWTWDPSKAYIKEAVKQSLKRLNTEYIDLYQLHGGTIEDPIEETIEAFEELKDEGLIRHYGISSIRPNVIKKYISLSNIVSVMVPYSLLDRRVEELLPLFQENEISVIARGPLAKGALTAKSIKKTPADGVLNYSRSDILSLKDKVKTLNGRSITEVALQFPLCEPSVATVIPGASSLAQLKLNIKAATKERLSQEEINTLKAWTKEGKFTQHRD